MLIIGADDLKESCSLHEKSLLLKFHKYFGSDKKGSELIQCKILGLLLLLSKIEEIPLRHNLSMEKRINF